MPSLQGSIAIKIGLIKALIEEGGQSFLAKEQSQVCLKKAGDKTLICKGIHRADLYSDLLKRYI